VIIDLVACVSLCVPNLCRQQATPQTTQTNRVLFTDNNMQRKTPLRQTLSRQPGQLIEFHAT